MTKYILVGGYPHKAPDEGKGFAEELIKDFNQPIKILDCLFARPRDNWEKAYEQDKVFFQKHLPDKTLEIQLADPKKFIEQVKWSNAIYMRGGKEATLLSLLSQNPGWEKEASNKTVAGSSAGAYILSKYYYDLDALKLGEGLGILPIKTLVHYKSDYNSPNINWDKVLSELKNYKEDLPLYTLKEGEFVVIDCLT